MSSIRNWIVFLFGLVLVCSCQAQKDVSIQSSVVLVGGYDELRAVFPDRTEAIKPPVELPANHAYFVRPSLSPNGELVAWGFVTRVEERRVHYALGVYSLKDRSWKIYGDFPALGQACFSADSTRVLFVAGDVREKKLMTLDVSTGNISHLPSPHPQAWATLSPISWSPDGKRVALVIQRSQTTSVGILEISSGEVVDLGEGDYPSWSPDGNWIAVFDGQGAKCILVRADGSGRRVLKEVRRTALLHSYKQLGWGLPVWSPDGQQMLLTEMVGDDSMDVILIRVQDGDELQTAHKHLPAFGWAALSTADRK